MQFPPDPTAEGFLERQGHNVYWLEAGVADGVPILILPPGPGAEHSPDARALFGDAYRVIQIDPRGCGRSEPAGSTIDNTLTHLVEDLEILRTARGIDRWLIVGHLWGAALAIAYAKAHRERCLGLLLASIYLGDDRDRDWFFGGIAAMMPAEWVELLAHLSAEGRDRPVRAFRALLGSRDSSVVEGAAAALMKYDRAIMRYWPGTVAPDDQLSPADLHFLNIFLHYLDEQFTAENSVLRDLEKARGVRATIVQGRFDVASGMGQAVRLAAAWPEAELVTPLGGCGYRLEPMRSAVRDAVDLISSRAYQ